MHEIAEIWLGGRSEFTTALLGGLKRIYVEPFTPEQLSAVDTHFSTPAIITRDEAWRRCCQRTVAVLGVFGDADYRRYHARVQDVDQSNHGTRFSQVIFSNLERPELQGAADYVVVQKRLLSKGSMPIWKELAWQTADLELLALERVPDQTVARGHMLAAVLVTPAASTPGPSCTDGPSWALPLPDR